ncbi:WhiB family transcriptional regulator [Rhodococcus sp. BP-252]|uniref:WhiB family transcriptional regulator n=1 Tax=Nocardiaceae TaxID=85025 RepID=UPI000A046D2B|nr:MULTISPECIES: WhiB family transcriptional regulator [Rhodococcus]MBY6410319.1 WhiB family transcriptional regulator [Rhodococcus sp. BP-320]MBY6416201.1 WhiB family transcriptional regulator [Rhodococcus sp. BP-321]MBY6420196.1 WhiB family transcriptional regulator [Rhodococcus sp. BP-324]MBY6424875.1 WhiB family transcriptional regulator [Rhodococcus sp. BP-323]MBY6430419.1 WhiB family transcriptional regulator [Rhodococcus sp. BP-322]
MTSPRVRDVPTKTVWLPPAVTEEWDWQLHGKCRGHSSSQFFHPYDERGHARVRREQEAKAICTGCPVLEQCRSYALKTREPYGVWGGMSQTERADYLRAQRKTA